MDTQDISPRKFGELLQSLPSTANFITISMQGGPENIQFMIIDFLVPNSNLCEPPYTHTFGLAYFFFKNNWDKYISEPQPALW